MSLVYLKIPKVSSWPRKKIITFDTFWIQITILYSSPSPPDFSSMFTPVLSVTVTWNALFQEHSHTF